MFYKVFKCLSLHNNAWRGRKAHAGKNLLMHTKASDIYRQKSNFPK